MVRVGQWRNGFISIQHILNDGSDMSTKSIVDFEPSFMVSVCWRCNSLVITVQIRNSTQMRKHGV